VVHDPSPDGPPVSGPLPFPRSLDSSARYSAVGGSTTRNPTNPNARMKTSMTLPTPSTAGGSSGFVPPSAFTGPSAASRSFSADRADGSSTRLTTGIGSSSSHDDDDDGPSAFASDDGPSPALEDEVESQFVGDDVVADAPRDPPLEFDAGPLRPLETGLLAGRRERPAGTRVVVRVRVEGEPVPQRTEDLRERALEKRHGRRGALVAGGHVGKSDPDGVLELAAGTVDRAPPPRGFRVALRSGPVALLAPRHGPTEPEVRGVPDDLGTERDPPAVAGLDRFDGERIDGVPVHGPARLGGVPVRAVGDTVVVRVVGDTQVDLAGREDVPPNCEPSPRSALAVE